jgi:hypothetical protein
MAHQYVGQNTMTYIDKKPGFRRTYTLSDEALVIEGKKWLGGSFRQEFSLNRVKPEPDEHRLKDDTNSALVGMPGLAIFMIGVIGGTAIYEKSPVGFYAILGAGLAAMIVGFVLGGRMRVLLFKSHDEVPLFDVASRGSGAAAFDTFTSELKARIRVANAKSASK